MKLTIDFSDFRPRSGAIDAWEKIEAAGKLDDLEAVLDDIYPDGMSDGELNDLLWFEPETVFEWLGMLDEEEDEEDIEDKEFFRFCEHFSTCIKCPLFAEISIPDCAQRIHGEEHDKLFACIDGKDKNEFDESILNAD